MFTCLGYLPQDSQKSQTSIRKTVYTSRDVSKKLKISKMYQEKIFTLLVTASQKTKITVSEKMFTLLVTFFVTILNNSQTFQKCIRKKMFTLLVIVLKN